MTIASKLDRSAVLIMDYQPAILRLLQAGKDPLVARAQNLLTKARAAGLKIIYVNVSLRAGYPEVSERNKRFSAIKKSQFLKPGAECEPDPGVPPQPEDVLVAKRRFSAFTGSDLEVVLRANNVNHLVLFGVSTSGVVLSTVRQAGDADYEMTIIKDLCADGDAIVHEVLFEKIFPVQADIMSSDDFIASLPA
jgi:nicotinamidase-related amidase